jgi:hypothetical protein
MEMQLACFPHILAGVRAAGHIVLYVELLWKAEAAGLGGDVDDAFDAAFVCADENADTEHGNCDADDFSALHDESILGALSAAVVRVVHLSPQAKSSSPTPQPSQSMCVLSHWPCAPRRFICNDASASLSTPSSSSPPSALPCYWLSLVASVCLENASRYCAEVISLAVMRWSSQQAEISASASASASTSASASISTISHHAALEIHSKVSPPPPPPPPFVKPVFEFHHLIPVFIQLHLDPPPCPFLPSPAVIAAAIQRGFMGYVYALSCMRCCCFHCAASCSTFASRTCLCYMQTMSYLHLHTRIYMQSC